MDEKSEAKAKGKVSKEKADKRVSEVAKNFQTAVPNRKGFLTNVCNIVWANVSADFLRIVAWNKSHIITAEQSECFSF